MGTMNIPILFAGTEKYRKIILYQESHAPAQRDKKKIPERLRYHFGL
jgi:hypothetical protein